MYPHTTQVQFAFVTLQSFTICIFRSAPTLHTSRMNLKSSCLLLVFAIFSETVFARSLVHQEMHPAQNKLFMTQVIFSRVYKDSNICIVFAHIICMIKANLEYMKLTVKAIWEIIYQKGKGAFYQNVWPLTILKWFQDSRESSSALSRHLNVGVSPGTKLNNFRRILEELNLVKKKRRCTRQF